MFLYKSPNKQYCYNFYVAFVTFFVISAICNTRVSTHDFERYLECRSFTYHRILLYLPMNIL